MTFNKTDMPNMYNDDSGHHLSVITSFNNRKLIGLVVLAMVLKSLLMLIKIICNW
jgi:hypothetical protein